METTEETEEYDYCPLCGESWDNHDEEIKNCDGGVSGEAVCKPEVLLKLFKPTFLIEDLDEYKESFLKKIILWQDFKVKQLNGEKISYEELMILDK